MDDRQRLEGAYLLHKAKMHLALYAVMQACTTGAALVAALYFGAYMAAFALLFASFYWAYRKWEMALVIRNINALWLLLLALAAPVQAQGHRLGLCILNVGQMVPEVDTHVRAGNMGNEYSCYTAMASIGGRWDVGITIAPTWLFVWPKDGDINRWSWRPEGQRQKRMPFVWTWPEVGYRLPAGPVELRPNVGLMWPTQTSYAWGAPVGMQPSAGLDLIVHIGKMWLAARPRVVWKRPAGWTVLYDFTVETQPTPHVPYWLTPISVAIGLTW